jgi:hypothetical protein
MPSRRRHSTRGLVAVVAVALGGLAAPAVLAVSPDGVTPAATGDYTPPVTTMTTPYVAGTHLAWSIFEQPALDGTVSLPRSAVVNGVATGPGLIVEVGEDGASGSRAASWTSTDGGVSWTEHVQTSGPVTFWHIAAHAGVFVALAPGGLYSSTDGATWTKATTGPTAGPTWEDPLITTGPRGFLVFVPTTHFINSEPVRTSRLWVSASGAPGTWAAAPDTAIVRDFCPASVEATSTRVVAVGVDCNAPSHGRVLVSSNGRSFSRVAAPAGSGYLSSVSFTGGRFLISGFNAAHTATWVWSSTTGASWQHMATLPRPAQDPQPDLVRIDRLGAGWVAAGTASIGDGCIVVWRSVDLVHWKRSLLTITGMSSWASGVAVSGSQLIIVGTLKAHGTNDWVGETWIAAVAP